MLIYSNISHNTIVLSLHQFDHRNQKHCNTGCYGNSQQTLSSIRKEHTDYSSCYSRNQIRRRINYCRKCHCTEHSIWNIRQKRFDKSVFYFPLNAVRGIALIRYVTPAITIRYIKNVFVFIYSPPFPLHHQSDKAMLRLPML